MSEKDINMEDALINNDKYFCPTGEKEQHALEIAAQMLTDKVSGIDDQRQFFIDVCWSFACAAIKRSSGQNLMYNPKNSWTKVWKKDSGLFDSPESMEYESVFSDVDLKLQKQALAERLEAAKQDLNYAKYRRELARQDVINARNDLERFRKKAMKVIMNSVDDLSNPRVSSLRSLFGKRKHR